MVKKRAECKQTTLQSDYSLAYVDEYGRPLNTRERKKIDELLDAAPRLSYEGEILFGNLAGTINSLRQAEQRAFYARFADAPTVMVSGYMIEWRDTFADMYVEGGVTTRTEYRERNRVVIVNDEVLLAAGRVKGHVVSGRRPPEPTGSDEPRYLPNVVQRLARTLQRVYDATRKDASGG
jgi:hypothetical protein